MTVVRGFHECLDTDVLGDPALQIPQILARVAAGSARRATLTERIEQPQRNDLLSSGKFGELPCKPSLDSARAPEQP